MTETGPLRRWTPDRLDKIKLLREQGKTYSEIAFIMHVTKNAVIGAFERYIGFGEKKARLPPKPKKPPNYIIKSPDRRGGHHGNKGKHSAPLPVESVHVSKPVSFPPESGHCLSIVGEARELRCCGLPVAHERSYCHDHCVAYYVPNIPRA